MKIQVPFFAYFCFLSCAGLLVAQEPEFYTDSPDQLLPFRMPLPASIDAVTYLDFDDDNDPDAIRYMIHGDIPILWIDDDDDMLPGALEGDLDSDCLLIDRNKDGIFAGPWDLSIDFADENNNGKADIQLIVDNGDDEIRSQWDWSTNIMWFIDDGEEDENFAYIDWNRLNMRCWEHYGHSNFYTDYHGQNTFTKMSVSSFRLADLRYSWENPFYFYDMDQDTHSEMSVRFEDTPLFRNKQEKVSGRVDDSFFEKEMIDEGYDAAFTGVLDKAYISFDLDNDNGPSNEFDFDMTLQFNGEHGYDYNHHQQPLKHFDGLTQTDAFMYDSRWRHLKELIYPPRESVWDILFNDGNWEECWFTFDEDDDCNRWERVELLQPKAIFKQGMLKGGIDHNPQADGAGDRGEWDLDNSGKGNLYVGKFDGRLHLFGAEQGAWRIDQDAYSFQGWGGLYNRSSYQRNQLNPEYYATVKYSDENGNGFFDHIEYDLDGDKSFEFTLSFDQLGLDDQSTVIQISTLNYDELVTLHSQVSESIWNRSQQAVALMNELHLNTQWYSFLMQPTSVREKYSYGYWLNFYCYLDIREHLLLKNKGKSVEQLDRAFLSGDWEMFQVPETSES